MNRTTVKTMKPNTEDTMNATRSQYYEPAVIKTPTGKFIWVGTIPADLENAVFDCREMARLAYSLIAERDRKGA